MDARILFNELLDEIAEDEVALGEKKELVRLLKKRLDREDKRAVKTSSGSVVTEPEAPAAEVDEEPTGSFAQLVTRAVAALGDKEFVVGDVHDKLKEIAGAQPLPFRANPKITTVLKRMYDSGGLIRTFEGGGNVPHKYRAASAGAKITAERQEEASLS